MSVGGDDQERLAVSLSRHIRNTAARLIREWADRRLISGYDSPGGGARSGGVDSVSIGQDTRAVFERCVDDIERGGR